VTPSFLARFARCLGLSAFSLAASSFASAATQVVDSLAALQSALKTAAPGDTLTLKKGVYTTSEAITVNSQGLAGKPITIAAEAVGEVEIAGTHGFNVIAPATYIVIQGFNFAHAAGQNKIATGATHVRFTRNTFHCAGPGAELDVAGDDAEVDHNEFRDKKVVGNMLSIMGPGDPRSVAGAGNQVARRTWVHHNYFHDYANARANGAETIRLGRSWLSMSHGEAMVEYNLFVRCVGENELITNKSGGNTYRYNTFLDSPGCQLTLRHGNECKVYGNIFRNTDGLRIFGDRHQIFSNYFEGNTRGINLGNGGAEVADGAPLTSHDRPDDCVIVFNTFVNNASHYELSHRDKGLGAVRTTFANNLIQGGGRAVQVAGPNTGATWSGNLFWQTTGAGDIPPEGFSEANPLLAPEAEGIYRVQAGSPAIGSAEGEFSFVNVDLAGRPRPAKKSKGADELLPTPGPAHLLTVRDVGPAAP
jgi:poly(beta-D-mannuronate) lyase